MTVPMPQIRTPQASRSNPGVARSRKLRLIKKTTTSDVRVEKMKFSEISRSGEP